MDLATASLAKEAPYLLSLLWCLLFL